MGAGHRWVRGTYENSFASTWLITMQSVRIKVLAVRLSSRPMITRPMARWSGVSDSVGYSTITTEKPREIGTIQFWNTTPYVITDQVSGLYGLPAISYRFRAISRIELAK